MISRHNEFVNGMKKCSFCQEPGVGQCTLEANWHVCRRHFHAAACNGFMPKQYVLGAVPISPEIGIKLYLSERDKSDG